MAGRVVSAQRSRTKLVIAAAVCLQVAVPLWATWEGIPHKFGFHMFTRHASLEVQVVDGDGVPLDIHLSDWIVVPRADIDWTVRLPPLICEDVAEAATVTVRQRGIDRTQTC